MPLFRSKVWAFVTLFVWVGSLAAQQTSDFSSEKMLAHVQFLASEELHGRGAGTGDERRAAEYISAPGATGDDPL